MAENHNFEYTDLALVQIIKAIECYKEDNSSGYVCAVSLSSAAEGIISDLQKRDSVSDTAYYRMKKELALKFNVDEKEVYKHLDLTRLAMKHYKPEFCEKEINIQIQSNIMIHRAIFAYAEYTNKITKKLKDFTDAHPAIALFEEEKHA